MPPTRARVLDPEWQGTFTLCDFRGGGGGSGIVSFKLKPREPASRSWTTKKFVWSIEATDGAWGPDGAFWISDWVDGWEPVGRGRIYRFYDTNTIHQPIVKSTRELLASDFGTKSFKALLDLLAHRISGCGRRPSSPSPKGRVCVAETDQGGSRQWRPACRSFPVGVGTDPGSSA